MARPRRRRLRRLLLALAVLAAAWLAWEAATWPDVGALARRNPTRRSEFLERLI